MKFSISDFIDKTELNDCRVLGVEFDRKHRSIKMFFDSIYWFNQGKDRFPLELTKGGYVTIKNYYTFEARYFLPIDRIWVTLDYDNLEWPVEINLKTYDNETIILAGNGKSGYWIEYVIELKDAIDEIFFE